MISRPRMLNEPPGSGLLSRIATVIVYVLASFLLALLFLNLYFSRNYMFTRVDGRSMQNTLQNNDWLYTDTRAAAERGQVVIIDVTDYPDKYKPDKDNADQERSIIKRLIAVEGDCVKCEYGIVYVKYAGGEYRALEEDYAYGTTGDFKEVEVGEGEIFFLGDNRSISHDSRAVGCLKYSDIIGVVQQWAIDIKWYSTGWENFRAGVVNFFGSIFGH